MFTGSTHPICQSERMKNAPLSNIRNIIAYADKLEQEGRSIIHLELGEPEVYYGFFTFGINEEHFLTAASQKLEFQIRFFSCF